MDSKIRRMDSKVAEWTRAIYKKSSPNGLAEHFFSKCIFPSVKMKVSPFSVAEWTLFGRCGYPHILVNFFCCGRDRCRGCRRGCSSPATSPAREWLKNTLDFLGVLNVFGISYAFFLSFSIFLDVLGMFGVFSM